MSIAQLTVGDRVSAYGRLIRFSHSIFALPFVLAMCVICAENYPFSVMQGVWILFAVVSARSAAMAFNRIVDRYIDAKNPRTAGREIPSGEVGVREAVVFCTASCLLFLLSSWQLGAHCLVVAPFVLIVLLGYSFTKRFTSYSHIV
ncbi:MAG: UbiA family prenyltransferase, partial [Bdellovibrionales bacterium]|nr:UbiA family prenyltransferase [Bdellovibrionales bacterium]